MSRRKDRARTPGLWVATNALPRTGGHPFYQRLNQVLDQHGFDAFVEAQCATFYAPIGRPSLARRGRLLELHRPDSRGTAVSHHERPRLRGESVLLHRKGLCCNFRAATSGWPTFGKHRTGSPIMPSDNPFKWRQFEPALILQCVRWYLRYALSYRDLEDMMRERGLCVDHTTIYRWVQRYAPEIDKRCRPFLRRTNDSYRIDETYVRVAGAWTYLYRGVDSNGDTLDFLVRCSCARLVCSARRSCSDRRRS